MNVSSQTWIQVSESNEAVIYINPRSIKKWGNMARVWEVQDLKTRLPQGVISFRAYIEIDCLQERRRILELSAFNQNMAKGLPEVVIDSPDKWSFVSPNSPNRDVFDAVCEN